MSARAVRESEVISQGGARLAVACVPLAIACAFLWPGGADIASVILVVIGVAVLLRARGLAAPPPLALAGLWIAFLLLVAIYAMAWGAPGRPFKGLEKHLPLALGPFVAVALSAACHRLGFDFNRLVALFLTGLVGGALVMLVRSGALGMFAHGWPQFSDDLLGKVNRNYAALACGVALIAIVALTAYLAAAKHIRMLWRAGAIAGLALIFLGTGVFLAMLQSRTAYAATAIGLAIWCGLVMRAGWRGAGLRAGLAVPATIVVVAAACVAFYFPLISERISAGGSTAVYLTQMYEMLRGNAVDAASLSMIGAERLQLVAVALDLIRQRPWLGWGPDASQLITLFSPYADIRYLTQFHNGYLQVLVSFGVIGGILNAALVVALLWSALRRRRALSADRLAPPLFAATVALVAYVLVTNVTESIIFVKPVAIICMILAALACMKDRATTGDIVRQH
ncbi:MAG: O-antigen ligase family protein [Rhizobiales bacterium]|nr:O-antigen ligase family protein [Hyphomicrobiales bacterium]